MMNLWKSLPPWTLIFICFNLSLTATVGSLYFSEVLEFVPCDLCWYQRIFMYPLPLIFLLGMFPLEKSLWRFTLPLSLIGMGISFYHLLLIHKIITPELTPCRQGIPCSETYINWLGFINIPTMSFMAFSLISLCLLLFRQRIKL